MQGHVIVSRHEGAVKWIKAHYPQFGGAPVLAHADAESVKNKHVIGNLPLHLAAEAKTIYAIEFDTPPRGAEWTEKDMEKAGARLVRYTVYRTENLQRLVTSESSAIVGDIVAKTYGEVL